MEITMGADENNLKPTHEISHGPIGLLAGAGRLPVLIAEGIKQTGHRLVVLGIKGQAETELQDLADEFTWVGLTRLGGWIRFFRRQGVRQAVMAGGVRKANMYSPLRLIRYLPDFRTARIWYRKLRHDKRDKAVLQAVTDELAKEGIELISSVKFCQEHLADEGVMTKRQIPDRLMADIDFGFEIARRSASLDIGQAVAVKEADIIAVEAMEGTDEMIARAGRLCKTGGWTLVKVARPDQDMRFDVPTVGPGTIEALKSARAACMVVEAKKTIILDKPETIALADRLGLAVVGRLAN
ncbi:MAG: UDP-2,3-diacylglucosamine diphosphatase LpxI [Planctomycetes bacterium]|nr:UDP-2,3-diacylglucosamine diphosphatase LpxI [Planctomycetota bacterium]